MAVDLFRPSLYFSAENDSVLYLCEFAMIVFDDLTYLTSVKIKQQKTFASPPLESIFTGPLQICQHGHSPAAITCVSSLQNH